MIYFENKTLSKILNKVEEDNERKMFFIDDDIYYIINNYLELKELNLKHKFINIKNNMKEESQNFNDGIEDLLDKKYFIIKFNIDLKRMKNELEIFYKYACFKNCIFLGDIENSVELEDDECFEGGLILDYCLILGTVDFIFDPVYFEANMCKFLNKIEVHDLSDSFIARYSEFKNIEIETHMIKNIHLDGCSGEVLNINFDYHEPNFDFLEMGHCDFENVFINSNKSGSKIINTKLVLIGCNFENLNIYKLYGKEVIIDDTNIANIIFTESIINQEFMFTRQSFNTINLIGTYFTGKILFDLAFVENTNMDKTFKYNITDEELIYNLESFLRIAINEDNPEIKLRLKHLRDVQKNKVYNKGIHRFLNRILDITTGYFTNYKRIVVTMITIIIFFGIVYSFFPQNIIIDDIPLNVRTENNYFLILYNSIYFSLITFTTIVYGNISPLGILKVLAGVEGLLGVLTSASLITVFARKFS